MDYVFKYAPGIILAVLHVLFLWAIISNLKRMLFCTKKVDATVESVSEHVHEHEDSETGKTTYDYSYVVRFAYEYNGKTYESSHEYSKHAHYFNNQETYIKINPLKPEESWTKYEIGDLLALSLSIPLLAFFDLIYYGCLH